MNDQRFFDLAMKSITRQSTDAERAELNSLVASQPELKDELEKLQAESRLAREVLPLVAATESSSGEFPAYARERLQTKVRQTLPQSRPPGARGKSNWRWILGLAAGTTAVVLLLIPLLTRPAAPIIQVAMLDTAGAVRGSDPTEIGILKQQWKESTVQSFDKANDLETWKTNWPQDSKPVAKVIYDRTAGEVRVILHGVGKPIQKVFVVQRDLAATLQEANAFVREQTRR